MTNRRLSTFVLAACVTLFVMPSAIAQSWFADGAALPAKTQTDRKFRFEREKSDLYELTEADPVFRGQQPTPTFAQAGPGYPTSPGPGYPSGSPGGPGPYGAQPYQPPAYGAPAGTQDPFLTYPDGALPQPMVQQSYGVNGPRPYRFGWTPEVEFGYLPGGHAGGPGAAGDFNVLEFDSELRYLAPLGNSWVFTFAPQFNMRNWDGPLSPNLPADVYRFGIDIGLETVPVNGFSVRLGFNPSLNTDFNSGINAGDAINYDATAALIYSSRPDLVWVLGATYWDRVDNIILPYAGVVWLPNDRWELRLLFPQGRISYFLGNFGSASHWLYATGGYHSESYQIDLGGGPTEQIQFTDWRVMVGLRSDHGWYDKFVEAGAVLGRKAEFRHGTPGFDISDSFIVRAGIRF